MWNFINFFQVFGFHFTFFTSSNWVEQQIILRIYEWQIYYTIVPFTKYEWKNTSDSFNSQLKQQFQDVNFDEVQKMKNLLYPRVDNDKEHNKYNNTYK